MSSHEVGNGQGLNCQKISGGVDNCLFIVIVITHRQFSIINNGGGLKLTPPGYPRAYLVWEGGLSKQLGGSTPNPPGNSNTKHWEWLNFKDRLSHVFNFWAKKNGTVSFKPCQIPWMPISSFVMLVQLFVQTCSALLAW
jgi:hypothetical protein